MIGGGESNVILEQMSEFSCECRGKLQSSVSDYLRVETKSRENMGEKELGNSSGVNVFSAGAINYPLCEAMVYHNHD